MSQTIYQNFKPLVDQNSYLYIKGNITGFETEGGETGATGYVGNQGPGGWSDVPAVIAVAHEFGEAVQPGNIRSVDVNTLFDYQGTVNITTGQSIAAIRGSATVANGTTLGGGSTSQSIYGVQGTVFVQGTTNVTSTGVVAALKGTLDTSATNATATSGYNSALHLDMGATSTITSSTVINAASIVNTSGCKINSVLKVLADANYFADLNDNSTGHWIVSSTGVTTQAKSLKVLIDGTVYYIPCCTGTT